MSDCFCQSAFGGFAQQVHIHSAKGLVSLVWKAGYSMKVAVPLQTLLARLSPAAMLRPTPPTVAEVASTIGAGLGNPVIHQHDAVTLHRRAQQEPGMVEMAASTRPQRLRQLRKIDPRTQRSR